MFTALYKARVPSICTDGVHDCVQMLVFPFQLISPFLSRLLLAVFKVAEGLRGEANSKGWSIGKNYMVCMQNKHLQRWQFAVQKETHPGRVCRIQSPEQLTEPGFHHVLLQDTSAPPVNNNFNFDCTFNFQMG